MLEKKRRKKKKTGEFLLKKDSCILKVKSKRLLKKNKTKDIARKREN